jgi:hypothetical protein
MNNGDTQMTLDEFKTMVARHDLTYNYSDDAGVRRLGHASYMKIKEAAEQLPREDAVRIWNSEVDRKLVDGTGFYWE